jgi:two-component system chemotaxis response regulator CheY
MRVLIVDDSKPARMFLRRSLPEGLGADLVESGGGAEAIEVCRAQKVDVMFLDLTMPEVDGFQVLEAMEASGLKVPTIVVSADVQPRAIARAFGLGAAGFVKKPATREQIGAALRKAGVL